MACRLIAVFFIVLAAAQLTVASKSKPPRKVPKSHEEQVENALEALDSDGHFSTLLSLLRSNKRCLEDFKSLSSLTLFAPTDEAFAEESVQKYLEKLTKKQTRQLLEFHGLPQYYSLSQLEEVFDEMISTVASDEDGETFQLMVQSDYSINTTSSVAQIITEAFDAFPVAVYIVSQVLIPADIVIPLPPPPPAPVPTPVSEVVTESLRVLSWSPLFRTFVRLLNTAEVSAQLQSLESFTLFAPTEKAFWSLSPELRSKLDDASVLAQVMRYHAVPAYYPPWFLGLIKAPVPTLATEGAFDHQLALRYYGGLKVSVETGVVSSFVRGIVFNRKPVVIYTVDHVLLPKEIF